MNQNGNLQPIFILPEGTNKTSGKNAQKVNIEAAKQVSEQVRSTLGPKGMDKMIVDSLGDVIITNDGVTILKEIAIEHPTAKMIVEIAKTQENEVGDGTTTVVILAGELLSQAQKLLDEGIHPTVIIKGYQLASEHALKSITEVAKPVGLSDTDLLEKIAMTAMTGKTAEHAKTVLAPLLVDALSHVATADEVDISSVKILTKTGGSVEQTELIEGLLLDKERLHPEMPKSLNSAKVALLNTPIEIKNTEIDAKIQITDPSQMQAFLDQEENMIKSMVKKVVSSGASVVLCQKGVDDLAQHYLAKEGILCVRRVKKSDMDKLSMATGAKIINNIDDLKASDLGFAGKVLEHKIGDENMIAVRECKNPRAVTLLVRGGSDHVIAEIKRALDDALGDLKATLDSGSLVAGAGSVETFLSLQLKKYAESLSGREQLAASAFAESLEIIPKTLSENAGLDPIDILVSLRAAHDTKKYFSGIDVFAGEVVNALDMGVVEPLKVKTQALSSAAEVATMILRIDDVIAGAPQDLPRGPPGMEM